MSPTCSSRFFVGKKYPISSAADQLAPPPVVLSSETLTRPEAYGMGPPTARGNRPENRPERRPRGAGDPLGGMFARAVRARSTHAGHAVAAIALTAVIGCGGGDSQDANEPSGDFGRRGR